MRGRKDEIDLIINNETFIPFHKALQIKNHQGFTFNESKNIYTKKNSFNKLFHYQICTIPDDISSIIAKSSCFTMLIFFNKCKLIIGNETIICMPYSIMFIKKGCHYKLQKKQSTDVVFIFDCHEDFFDNFIVSQIADCPIFYDLLNLTDAKNEYLLFDYQKDSSILSTLHLFLTELTQYKQAVHSAKNYKLLLVILMSQLDRNHIPYLVIHDSSMMQCYDEGKILKYLSDNFCTATLLLLVILMSQLDRNHIPYLVIHDSSMMQCYDEGKILKYLSDNFCTATLSSTAEYFNFHPAYFSTLFKKLFHQSFSKKLLSLKLEHAKRLLITTNLTTTAEYFNFHPAYFSTLFKKLFHQSFSKKLLSLKLEHAKRLLITTNLTTTEIMHCVGFNDKSYFFKSFKTYYQITPLQYRKTYSSLYQNKKNPTE